MVGMMSAKIPKASQKATPVTKMRYIGSEVPERSSERQARVIWGIKAIVVSIARTIKSAA